MLGKLRCLSRLFFSVNASSRSGRRFSAPALVEPVEPRLLLTTFIRYVDVNSPAAAPNGLSWSTAYRDLQSALFAANPAATDDFEIRVADGIYLPTARTTWSDSRTVTFSLKNRVTLFGGYAGHGYPDPDTRDIAVHRTILSGDIGVAGVNADNAYHVVTAASSINGSAVLDGFTVIGGNANEGIVHGYGGGMYIGGSPIVRNCNFTQNTARYGGGVLADAPSSPFLVNCTFSMNTAYQGGGMQSQGSAPTLVNCVFVANVATGSPIGYDYGGGIANQHSTTTMINCTLSGNKAGSGGGAFNYASTVTLTNCILWGNVATVSRPDLSTSSTFVSASHSNIKGGWVGTGILKSDPMFVRNPTPGPDGTWGTADDDCGDLRLQATSPCIDAGRNDAVPAAITTDLAGNPRFAGAPNSAAVVDIGAYEAIPPAPLILSTTADVDTFTLRLSPDGLSLQVWPATSTNGEPAAIHPLSGVTTCFFSPSPGLDTVRLDFSNGTPIPAAGLILPADDQIIVRASDTTRPDLLHTLRSLLAAGRIISTSEDPARALSPSINDDGDILIRLALRGDLTGDDALDGDDYFAMDRAFLMQDDLVPQADLTLDNRIDAEDYFLLDRAFLTLAPPPVQPAATSNNLFDTEAGGLSELLR